MKLKIVVAAAADNVIGANGRLPWPPLKTDLRQFKDLTLNHTVVMGRKTWESFPRSYRPLPGRRNIVLTNQRNYRADGAELIFSWPELRLLTDAQETVFAIGESVYRLALPTAETIYLTRVLAVVKGDAFMPELNPAEWWPTMGQLISSGAGDAHPFIFYRFDRQPAAVKIPID